MAGMFIINLFNPKERPKAGRGIRNNLHIVLAFVGRSGERLEETCRDDFPLAKDSAGL